MCAVGRVCASHRITGESRRCRSRVDVMSRPRPRRGRRAVLRLRARCGLKFVALSVVARAARGDGPDARAGELRTPHQPHNPSRRPASPVRSVHTTYTQARRGGRRREIEGRHGAFTRKAEPYLLTTPDFARDRFLEARFLPPASQDAVAGKYFLSTPLRHKACMFTS